MTDDLRGLTDAERERIANMIADPHLRRRDGEDTPLSATEQVDARLLTKLLALADAAFSRVPVDGEAVAWVPLADSDWVNIVNHDHAYECYTVEDAVNEAVKRTEARLRELNAAMTADQAKGKTT
jgi:hypothetical protein